MRAVRVNKDSGTPTLMIEDIPKPEPTAGEVLVKIKAAAVQPADILNSKGSFVTTTFPRTLGKDFAGTAVTAPSHLQGRDVYGTSGSTFGFTTDGSQAEFAVLREDCVAIIPTTLTFAQAAAVGTPFSTAYTALLRARAGPDDVVLVIAREVLGCRTIGVGRHGTDTNSIEDPTLRKAIEKTGGNGPDVVIDTVGDFALTLAAFNVLAPKGRLSTITAPRQSSTQLSVDILDLYRRQISLIGVNTAACPQKDMTELLVELTPAFESGKLVGPPEKDLGLLNIDGAQAAYERKTRHAVIVFE